MQAEDGENGDQGVSERVAEQDRDGMKSLGAGGADVVARKLLDYGDANHAREDGGERGAEGDGRKDEMRSTSAA